MSEETRQQAEAEGLTMVVAKNSMGYFRVYLNTPGQPKPYLAKVRRGGKTVYLGSFTTAEEAALCVARTPEGKAAAAEGAPLTSKEARQQAEAEGLTLRTSEDGGYFGVYLNKPGQPKPYQAHTSREGKNVHLGCSPPPRKRR